MSSETARVVGFLGLSGVPEIVADQARVPLGILYPYSRDLQRVCTVYASICRDNPDAASLLVGENPGEISALSPEQAGAVTTYLASIATLCDRIAFAPGPAGASVGAAHRSVSDTLMPPTRRGRHSNARRRTP